MNVNDNNLDVYANLSSMIEETFKVSEKTQNSDDGYDGLEYKIKYITEYFKAHKNVILVGIGYAVVVIHMILSVVKYLQSLIRLDTSVLSRYPFAYIIWMLIPFMVWAWSTMYDYYNFHNRKMFLMHMCIVNICMEFAKILYLIFAGILLPIFARIPVSNDVTLPMIYSLARLVLIILSVLPPVFITKAVLKESNNVLTKKKIIGFKLSKQIDNRKDKEFAYDMDIVKNLQTGERHVIKEKDRFLHSVANGTTGTGKTSSCFTCAIANDLDKIVHNKEYQKKQCEKLLKEGKIRLKHPMSDKDFDIDNFESTTGNDDILFKAKTGLKFRAKTAGITTLAPNASFADEIYSLATAKGLKVNRLDPTLGEDGHLKPGFKGFNPLYITPGLTPIEFIIEVSRKAVLFADVAQAIYDAEGQSDVYFASLNRNITTTLTMLVLFTYPSMNGGKQPTIETVQMVLNNFSKAEPYREKLLELYGKKDENGNQIFSNNQPVMELAVFQMILDVVDNEILGDGAEKMNDQCRGLRVIINTFLTNLNVKNVLCSEDSIDIEETLAKGEITLVNYALELGTSGKALGLFYMLSFINAVYRRPGNEDTRIPHFCYIDEFPVLLHPSMDACFSLFRQYRIAMFVAIQSLSQMDKTPSTSFMKPVLQGNCAHHFVFGRVAPEEMRMYEEMAGKSFKLTEQRGIAETALTADNPSISYNVREQLTKDNNIEGGDIRARDFQEVTMVTVDNGSPVDIFFGKVSFLPKYRRIKRKTYHVDWSKYAAVGYEEKVTDNTDNEQEERSTDMNNKLDKFKVMQASDEFNETHKKIDENDRAVPAFLKNIKSAENTGAAEQQHNQPLTENIDNETTEDEQNDSDAFYV